MIVLRYLNEKLLNEVSDNKWKDNYLSNFLRVPCYLFT